MPTITVPTIDPLLSEAFVIPFTKNMGGAAPAEDLGPFATAFTAHLATNPQATITITGHTDADGDAALNRRLSLSRAQAVAALLIELGIPAAHIHAAGAGADEPVAANLTSKGKARNRRVEIKLDPMPAQPQQP